MKALILALLLALALPMQSLALVNPTNTVRHGGAVTVPADQAAFNLFTATLDAGSDTFAGPYNHCTIVNLSTENYVGVWNTSAASPSGIPELIGSNGSGLNVWSSKHSGMTVTGLKVDTRTASGYGTALLHFWCFR